MTRATAPCDACARGVARLYCAADDAKLCLRCDRTVRDARDARDARTRTRFSTRRRDGRGRRGHFTRERRAARRARRRRRATARGPAGDVNFAPPSRRVEEVDDARPRDRRDDVRGSRDEAGRYECVNCRRLTTTTTTRWTREQVHNANKFAEKHSRRWLCETCAQRVRRGAREARRGEFERRLR